MNISGFTIRNCETGVSLLIDSGSSNITIRDNTIQTCSTGISSSRENSQDIVISDNTITDCYLGITASDSSSEIVVNNNTITDCSIGIAGTTSTIISNNHFFQNEIGVSPSSSVEIDGNTFSSGGMGIVFYLGEYTGGIFAIHDNFFIENEKGISFFGGSMGLWNGTVSGNLLMENQYGYYFAPTSDAFRYYISIFANNLTNNQFQVLFDGPDSTSWIRWDNGYPSGGNYWSDYSGEDSDGDGIGDTPYIINESNQDRYPLIITGFQPTLPVANFVWSSSPKAGYSTTFDATSTILGGNSTHTNQISTYTWNFGDGNTTTTNSPTITHTFTSQDSYTVTLKVEDIVGYTSTKAQLVQVRMPTIISISTTSSTSVVGFTAEINGTLHNYYGNGIENEPIILRYTFPGVNEWFPISSDITDQNGNYHVQWIPTATGDFTIKAEWSGNTTHIGAIQATTLSSLAYENQYVFSVESNSTVSEMSFNPNNWKLDFTTSGPDGTTGYIKVTVAKSLAADPTQIRVYIDNIQINYSITDSGDSWILHFIYNHSSHSVSIDFDLRIIPEFPLWTTLIILIVISIAILIIRRRNRYSSSNLNANNLVMEPPP